IRRKMIEEDVVDCIVALPPQLFFNTQIPACIWFLTRDKRAGSNGGRDRRGETLFIDARKLGRMETRVIRVFDDVDVSRIADAYHAWRSDDETGETYADAPGFCRAVRLDEIKGHDYVLTPGRYVGAEQVEDDGEAFAEQMQTLTAQLSEQFAESARLEGEINRNLARIGFELNS
ncbi:MAG: SAM-dependent methyltransferase, partial [Acidobacteriota bacterium]|nr:SAM-dependent methyltransferase [Acidobacteriota bacterium]